MSTLESVLIMMLALLAATITVVVILQQGRGADIGAAFGAGGANTIFGSTGLASPLAKLTWSLAGLFLVLCMTLAYLAKQRSEEANSVVAGDVPAMAGDVPTMTGDVPAMTGDVPAMPSAPRAGSPAVPAANSDVPVLPSAAGNSAAIGQAPASGAARPEGADSSSNSGPAPAPGRASGGDVPKPPAS